MDAIVKALDECGKQYKILNENNERVDLRCNISNEEESMHFINIYKRKTNTEWIQYSSLSSPVRTAMNKAWICQHSSRRKRKSKEQTLRNAECKAIIKIKNVTRSTRRTDEYLKLSPPLAAIITILCVHSHATEAADSLRLLRVSDETKSIFFGYFEAGMTASEARKLHESKLLMQEDGSIDILANASMNPTVRQVHYLHNIWREENFGSVTEPFVKLSEKIESYEKDGTLVRLQDHCALIVTPIAKRNQLLSHAREIIFVDSTSNCDTLHSTITVMLSATSAGALPICFLIHEGQSMVSYSTAFGLLKKHCGNCFGGNSAPEAFITDDSSAEKGALQQVWPSAKQFLCQFHVAQAEWRWLCSSRSSVPPTERQKCMKFFQNVMYAKNEHELQAAVNCILQLQELHTDFTQRFERFFEDRKEEWVTLFRAGVTTRNNNTNNFAEVTIRILKDIVLSRTKAFNVVALVDFCVSVWEEYYKKRLLERAMNRNQRDVLSFRALCSKMEDTKVEEIIKEGENLYSVPSQNKSKAYLINTEIGLCECPLGSQGAFCKHLAFVYKELNIEMPNVPAVNSNERHKLGKLALGNKCPPESFFYDYKKQSDNCVGMSPFDSSSTEHLRGEECMHVEHQVASDNPDLNDASTSVQHAESLESVKSEVDAAFKSALSLANEGSISALKKWAYSFKRIKTTAQLNQAIHTSSLAFRRATAKGGKIHVQPTAIARRSRGVTKGSRRIPSGRPPKNTQQKRKKRARNLAANISQNQPNAISHGTGH